MFYGEQTGYIPILSPPVAANPICAAPCLVPTRAVNEPSRTLVPSNHSKDPYHAPWVMISINAFNKEMALAGAFSRHCQTSRSVVDSSGAHLMQLKST